MSSRNSVSIIGGADGPTSIFIASRRGRQPLKLRLRNHIYKCRRRRAEKKITAGAHTLEEVAAYAVRKFGAVEVPEKRRKYAEQRKNLKESLILRNKPELLGKMKEIPNPDFSDEDSVRAYLEQLQVRSERIAEIPDSEIPMDFHMYEIEAGEGYLDMEVDFIWNEFGISYSGDKRAMKQFQKTAQDLYTYYGVTEDDIREKSERYSSLLGALST